MPDVGHAQHHIDMATAINTYHSAGLDVTIDSTPVDWGEGWVHPTSGSDSYDGSTRQTPKATIGAAVSAGFSVIHVGAGTHAWTGGGGNYSLIFHPGTHTFSNAPVVLTGNVNLLGLTPPPQHTTGTTGAANIRASGSPTDIFQLDAGGSQRWATAVRYLRFDADTFTRSAVYTNSLNTIDVDFNVINGTGWQPNRYLLYSTAYHATQTVDQSWGRITRNQCRGAGLAYYDWQKGWINRVVMAWNRGWAGGGTEIENPYIKMEAGNSQGHYIVGNSFEGSGTTGVDNTPLIYLTGKYKMLTFVGNVGELINTTDRVAYKLGDTAADVKDSIIHHSIGSTAANGYIEIAGTKYTTGTVVSPDTDTTYRNSIIIAGRVSY